MRRDREHPLHQVTFASSSGIPRKPLTRKRVGKPRLFWTHQNMKLAWETIKNNSELEIGQTTKDIGFDINNTLMRTKIAEAAKLKIPPFHKEAASSTTKQATTLDTSRRSFQPTRARQGGGNHARRLNPFGQIPFG